LIKALSDTTNLHISNPIVIDNKKIIVDVNDKKMPTNIKINSNDSLDFKEIKVDSLLPIGDSLQLLLFLNDTLENRQYQIISSSSNRIKIGNDFDWTDTILDTLDETSIYDSIISDTILFNSLVAKDTIKPKINSISIVNEKCLRPQLAISFSEIVSGTKKIIFSDSINNFEFNLISKFPNNKAIYQPLEDLEFSKTLFTKIKDVDFKDLGGLELADSLREFDFETVKQRDQAISISIKYQNSDDFKDWQWVLEPIDSGTMVNMNYSDTSFTVKNVPSGKYKVSFFDDKDNDLSRNLGTLFPFQYGEIRGVMEDTIIAKGRWSSEEDFPKECLIIKWPDTVEIDTTIKDSLKL
jgi:hypothetical protein